MTLFQLVRSSRGFALALCVCAGLIGCGDDDSSGDASPPDASSDVGIDASTDAAPDASTDADEDASTDASEDASADAGEDASADAAVDAADVCDTAVEGDACDVEGESCGGPCTDECSFCNIISCREGTWQRFEVFPVPCFSCGDDLRCVVGETYCAHGVSDVAGEPDMYRCVDTPPDCAGDADCACIATSVAYDMCEESDGGIVVTFFGG